MRARAARPCGGLEHRVALALERAPEQLAKIGSSSTTRIGRWRSVVREHGDEPLAVDGLGEIVGGAEGIAEVPVVHDRAA